MKSKRQQIIEEYLKDTSQKYIDVFHKLKDKIENLTYIYVKRILYEFKKETEKDKQYQTSEKVKNTNQGDNTKQTKTEEKNSFSIIKRKKKVLFVSDIHVPFHDVESVRKAFEYGLDEHVNTIVLGGDIMDNHSVSFWKNRHRSDFVSELNAMRNFLSEVRETFVNSKIYYIWGNHELRHEKYILSNAEKLFGVEELELENLLKLSEFQIRKVDNRDYMARFKEPFSIGKLYYLHGHEVRASWGVVNIARNLFLKTQDNIIFGHFHQTQEYIQKDIKGHVKGSWAVGCLCDMNPDYAIVNNWNHGFAVIEYEDNGEFTVYNKKIINGKVV